MSDAKRGRLVAQLRADYLARVEALAEKLRARFESGELRSGNQHDEDEFDRFPADRRMRMAERQPAAKLERECRRHLLPTPADAFLVALCSPSVPCLLKGDGDPVLSTVAEMAAMRDVLRIARARRWYTPDPTESPTNKQLGLPAQLTKRARSTGSRRSSGA